MREIDRESISEEGDQREMPDTVRVTERGAALKAEHDHLTPDDEQVLLKMKQGQTLIGGVWQSRARPRPHSLCTETRTSSNSNTER